MVLILYSSVAKGLKLKNKNVEKPIPTFGEVKGKNGRGYFWSIPS